jgi:glycosyltransferase involved in cell wall biosynthesis
MKMWMQHFDANVFLSDSYQDIEFARKNNITRNHLITNAASEEEFDKPAQTDIRKKFDIGKDKFLVLHVGSFTGAKGQPEALKIFLKANIPNSVLLLSGHNNSQLNKLLTGHPRFATLKLQSLLKGKRIIVTELDRSETVDAYKAADLFLFPSNIECSPIVLFECMAAGIPFLSSEVGNAAEIALWGGNGIILPTEKDSIGWSKILIDESAQLLKHSAANRRQLKNMGEKGRAAWKKQFTWQKVAEQYEKLYLSLA